MVRAETATKKTMKVRKMASKHIIIIGAGAAGIRMGIRLREMGISSFQIVEKDDSVGGTWRDNTYPGVACDVPAQYYCYPFAPNTTVKNTFATGSQLWDYFQDIATRFEIDGHIRFGVEVTDAEWVAGRWKLTTTDGEILHADIVIGAVGRLRVPHYPVIEGLDDFGGPVVHSARWDKNLSLEGKRVGIIGNGSSAVQIISATVDNVGHLDVYQRTAQWVYPWKNKEIDPEELEKARTSDSEAIRAYDRARDSFRALFEGIAAGADAEKRNAACVDALNSVKDPVLRAKLTPDYPVGCKRLVVSGTFYDAIQRPNVSVVTERIARVEREGIRMADGALRPLDIIVLATGFHADSYLRPMRVTGEDGMTLDDIWSDVFLNYNSIALPFMPNFFMVNGPFSPGGSISIIEIIETHVNYVARLIDRVVKDHVEIAPKIERSEKFVNDARERAKKTIWYTGGCSSWYLDANGVPLVNPLTSTQLEELMRDVVFSDFNVRPAQVEVLT